MSFSRRTMKLNRRIFGVFGIFLITAIGSVALYFVAHGAETPSEIRVDHNPINRDPRSGNSYSPVVKKVASSVVNIYSTRIVKQRYYTNPFMADPFFRQFFGGSGSDGERERISRDNWLGSGVVISPSGYILTASHVVEGADEIKVGIKNDRTIYSAKVVGMDPPTDVAILKIEAKELPALTLGDSDQLEVGDVVLAVGNPFGVGQTVTRGIISALGRTLEPFGESRQYQDFIQTDAAINQGNSGGALVDAEGRLIGINDAIASPSGTSAGIGFAIPINMARSVMESLIKGGKVARGFLGIESQDVNSDLAQGFGAPNAEGALVGYVEPGSPAAKAGLRSGDIILTINDKEILGSDNLSLRISELHPGSQAQLKVFRNGVVKMLTAMVGERPEEAQDSSKPADTNDNNVQPAKADALDGVEVQDLSPRIRHQLRAPEDLAGALVTNVDRGSNSYEAGLRQADIITEINHQPVTNAKDAEQLGRAARSERIIVKVWRHIHGTTGGIVRFLSVDNAKRTN